jgi:hypothetical protein
MRLTCSILLLALTLLLAAHSPAAEPKRLNIVDYFTRLPDQTLEAPAPQILKFIQQSKETIIDIANGYMKAQGDGAQGDIEAALFRYKDDRPLLALMQGEPAETDYWYLHFYELGDDGKMKKVDRKILRPDNEPRRQFELPRKGRTIVVRDTKTKKVTERWTWNGEKFVEEK